MPIELQAKSMAANTKNLPTDDALASREFDKRVKVAELMLKEADIQNKAKIVEKWVLEGTWIESANFDTLAYGQDGLATITTSLRMDRCILVY